MASLKTNHKTFIVKQLAIFESVSSICKNFKKRYGFSIDRRQVSYYNPQTLQGRLELAPKWRELFSKTREKFIAESGNIPIAQKTYRLRELQKIYHKLSDQEHLTEACKVLEQAAKEMGGIYRRGSAPAATNRPNKKRNLIQMINRKIEQKNLKSANKPSKNKA